MTLGGTREYLTCEWPVLVCVPEKYPYCKYCINWCKYEPNFNRHSCRLTGEWLFDTEHEIGELCPLRVTYPIAFDIEDNQYCSAANKPQNTTIADAFLAEIEKGGYVPILYTYKSFAENFLNMSALSKYDFWVAQYASKCTYTGPYTIWQHSGDKQPNHPAGACAGVTGSCDLNTAYKDYAAKPTEPEPNYKALYEEAQGRIDKMKNYIAGA